MHRHVPQSSYDPRPLPYKNSEKVRIESTLLNIHFQHSAIHLLWIKTTYSGVSRVRMVRMGRRFMPPMQELLHMKLRRIVVLSEPSWNTKWQNKTMLNKLPPFTVQSHSIKSNYPKEAFFKLVSLAQSYLRKFIWDGHTVPLCVRILKISGQLAALNPDQMGAMFYSWRDISTSKNSHLHFLWNIKIWQIQSYSLHFGDGGIFGPLQPHARSSCTQQ